VARERFVGRDYFIRLQQEYPALGFHRRSPPVLLPRGRGSPPTWSFLPTGAEHCCWRRVLPLRDGVLAEAIEYWTEAGGEQPPPGRAHRAEKTPTSTCQPAPAAGGTAGTTLDGQRPHLTAEPAPPRASGTAVGASIAEIGLRDGEGSGPDLPRRAEVTRPRSRDARYAGRRDQAAATGQASYGSCRATPNFLIWTQLPAAPRTEPPAQIRRSASRRRDARRHAK
jgi:hypothetical protein